MAVSSPTFIPFAITISGHLRKLLFHERLAFFFRDELDWLSRGHDMGMRKSCDFIELTAVPILQGQVLETSFPASCNISCLCLPALEKTCLALDMLIIRMLIENRLAVLHSWKLGSSVIWSVQCSHCDLAQAAQLV